jgi:hypothetical protein
MTRQVIKIDQGKEPGSTSPGPRAPGAAGAPPLDRLPRADDDPSGKEARHDR